MLADPTHLDPAHYSLLTLFDDYNPTTGINIVHIVSQLDVTVTASTINTLTADERTATSQITVKTPRPATADAGELVYSRTGADGQFVAMDMGLAPGSVYVSPSAKPQVGSFTYALLGWGGESPAGSPDPYRYDAMFPPTDHVDANQAYQVDLSTLTTVHNTVDTDPGETGHQGMYEMGPISSAFGGVVSGHFIPVPSHLTTYTGPPVGDASWSSGFRTTIPAAGTGLVPLMFTQDGPAYPGHAELSRTWGHGPLTAQVGQYTAPAECRACADGDTVDLGVNPIVDTNPDTDVATDRPAVGHLTVYRDGTQVFSQDAAHGVQLPGQAQQPGTYRMVFDLDLSPYAVTQSSMTHTDISVPYNPTPNPAWTLPAGNFCLAQGSSTTPCSMLLTVGHQSYGSVGARAAATGASVCVSFDKGLTWTPASVVPAGQNHFVALWKNGAKGVMPWLKVTATDALGGSIRQTVANAYTVG